MSPPAWNPGDDAERRSLVAPLEREWVGGEPRRATVNVSATPPAAGRRHRVGALELLATASRSGHPASGRGIFFPNVGDA